MADEQRGDGGNRELTSTRRLGRNVLLNLFAEGIPLVAAVFCIPILIHRLGLESFGVLTLAWSVIGYFGLFDMGLGRALSKIVAERLGRHDYGSIPALFWTGFAMMAALGLIGAVILASGAPFAIARIGTLSPALKHETLNVFYLLALTIPCVITTSGMMGVLFAHQRFDLVARVRIPVGIWMFLGPVIAVLVFHTLLSVVTMLVAGRCAMFLMVGLMCMKAVPGLSSPRLSRDEFKPLLGFGGWLTVSNLAGPIMDYMDRFLIAAIIGLSAVAYYATPYTIVVKIQILPNILLGVLFPALSTMLAYDRMKAYRTFEISTVVVLSIMLTVALAVIGYGKYGLEFWLGYDFAIHSTVVLQILMVGILINSLASLPYALIQADGRPDITAKLHLIELPVYVIVLWYAMHAWGIVGTAMAWAFRVTLDWMFLLGISAYTVKSKFAIRLLVVTVALVLSFWAMTRFDDLAARSIACCAIITAFISLNWLYLLDMTGRNDIKHVLKSAVAITR